MFFVIPLFVMAVCSKPASTYSFVSVEEYKKSEVSYELSSDDFKRAAKRYGIGKYPHILEALYFVESSNGKLLGKYRIGDVLGENSTQRKYFNKIRNTWAPHLNLDTRCSSSGAMGVMQIMPATFFVYAQDGDGDGIKDPMNPLDSLATAAYYCSRSFYRKGKSVKGMLMAYNRDRAYVAKVLRFAKKI
ncbi:MAG: transglycosylase SLT domain-containing protein [bacterium]|nr:transglycosylase SLT domain-containing protein [bacterium]